MANGALLQLIAYGAQDLYLTGNPSITYFKNVYRRHTNFAMETKQMTFNRKLTFGSQSVALVKSDGDLVTGMYLEVTLPALPQTDSDDVYMRWTDDIGHHLINHVDVQIDGQLIDRHYGDWLEIWSQLTLTSGKEQGYREMIGQDPRKPLGLNAGLQRDLNSNQLQPSRTLMVPLQFWFCRNYGLALPLIALQYSVVEIVVACKGLDALLAAFNVNTGENGNTEALPLPQGLQLVDAQLWVDYVFLDTDERRRFAQVPHEYLIEQVQLNEFERPSLRSATAQVELELDFHHPVKELVWVCQFQGAVTNGHTQHSNWTDRSAINYRTVGDQILDLTNLGSIVYDMSTLAREAEANSSANIKTALNPSYNRPPDALNPVKSATLLLEGNLRFAEQEGGYFNKMEPFRHHKAVPRSPGINVYSFALEPETHQPSGTCNFSKIRRAVLRVNTRPGVDHDVIGENNAVTAGFTETTVRYRVFARNYNVFRVMNGMGGVAYFD